MNAHFVRFFMLAAAALAACAIHLRASASPLGDDEATQVRNVIVAQMVAFQSDDEEAAFQTATPAVREAIGNSGLFLAMVRGAYPMVYRPASVSFHKPEETDGTVLQLVEIKDDNSKSWLALFQLEQQPDRTWRISGCVVAENNWKAI